jgi:hypothetical protein
MKHEVSPVAKVSVTSRGLNTSLEQVAVHFACLGHAMKRNSARQHEFAILLRVLSSRFNRRSTEHQALRLASQIARNKRTKLKNLVAGLGLQPSKPQRASPIFLVWFRLAQSAPLPLTIPLLHLSTEKAIRGRSLDAFYGDRALAKSKMLDSRPAPLPKERQKKSSTSRLRRVPPIERKKTSEPWSSLI